MALRDVKEYYYTMLAQYVETKDDLADFEEAFRDGYIAEDKLEEVRDDLELMKENLARIQYIMYLWEMPNRKGKKENFRKANSQLEEYFDSVGASKEAVVDENRSIASDLRKRLKKLAKAK